MPIKTAGFAAQDPSKLGPYQFERRDVGPTDVHIEVEFCGICHSDIHTVRGEWHHTTYPLVPGHEVAGIVKAVGANVKKVKVGDKAGVGCMVDSCRTCDYCSKDLEQFCLKHTQTYNSKYPNGEVAQGGYSRDIVVTERFVVKIPESMELKHAAPLLCAGITTYSAVCHYGLNMKGKKVAVIGLGGLGHVGVQILKAFGAEVSVISRSEKKKEDAMKMGATSFIISTDPEQVKQNFEHFDGMLDTVSASKDLLAYLSMLKADGQFVTVGAPPIDQPFSVHPFAIVGRRRAIGGSCIGGMKETQEMIEFCAKHDVKPWIEMIKMEEVNTAYDRVLKSDVKYRFVIDCKNSAPAVA